MPSESHARARSLLDQAVIEGISPDDQLWLNGHTGQCEECRSYAELSRRAVGALNSFAFELDPAAALRVEMAIRGRASRLASEEFQDRRHLIGAATAVLLTISSSFGMWKPAAWLAGRWHLPTPAWQIGFGACWLVPSILAAVLPLFRRKLIGDDLGSEGHSA